MTASGALPVPFHPPRRPRLRGWLHQGAFWASVAGLAALVHVADSTLALVAAWIYGCAVRQPADRTDHFRVSVSVDSDREISRRGTVTSPH